MKHAGQNLNEGVASPKTQLPQCCWTTWTPLDYLPRISPASCIPYKQQHRHHPFWEKDILVLNSMPSQKWMGDINTNEWILNVYKRLKAWQTAQCLTMLDQKKKKAKTTVKKHIIRTKKPHSWWQWSQSITTCFLKRIKRLILDSLQSPEKQDLPV